MMALIPILALMGVFGEQRDLIRSEHGSLAVTCNVPSRVRYRQHMTLDVAVTNRGAVTMRAVRFRPDSAYLNRFSNVSISPAVAPDGSVTLGDLPPGASETVTIALDADRVGTAHGSVAITTASGDSVRTLFQTFTFP